MSTTRSSIYRIELVLCAELYDHHLNWASFADRKSKLDSTSLGNSYCRRIESSVFIRNYIDFVSQVDWDWTIAFPKTFDFLNSEVERINDINELNIRNIFDVIS